MKENETEWNWAPIRHDIFSPKKRDHSENLGVGKSKKQSQYRPGEAFRVRGC
jgi:hypothetical protein